MAEKNSFIGQLIGNYRILKELYINIVEKQGKGGQLIGNYRILKELYINIVEKQGKGGQLIGNYRILKELKSGSFGSVYQAKHRSCDDNSVVAIKLLHAHLSSQQEHEQFLQEARLLKKLKHPHILPVFDAGTQDGIPYLLMEYAPGGSLRDRLDTQAGMPLPLDEALTILTQIGQALEHAHQQIIVHCDLKPDNILFNARNEVLLADFGIAAMLTTMGTKQIGKGGTPAYMAPEQFESFVSVKSDQYALGCIAYELVTGRKPFLAPNPSIQAMWYQHAQVNPTPPTVLNPHLPKHIEQAILKALAKNRADRHADVATFISALHESSEQWFQDGNALYKLNQYEEALVAYGQAIGLNPNYAKVYNNKGNAFYNLNRYEEALAAYEQAIGLNPNDATAYTGKGNALSDLKRYEEALAAHDQAIGLNPNYAGAYNNKGNALQALNRYEEALATYEHAIGLNPNDATAYNNKGNALYNLSRYEEALAAYDQTIRLNPNYAGAYNNKGNALDRLGNPTEAQQAYEKAGRLRNGSS